MAAIGIFGAVQAVRYPFEMDRIIGPAVFPLGLSLLLIVAGAAVLVEGMLSATDNDPETRLTPRWWPLLCIGAGLVAFMLLIERGGLVPAIVAAVLLSGRADPEASVLSNLLTAIVLALGCTAVFYWLLRLPLPPFAW
jgi:uncharacterized membrane protein YfcA